MKFLNNLDLNGNQLLSPVIHVSSQSTITNGPAGDTSGTEGQIFYNSHSNGKALFFRDNSAWRPIGDISGVTAGVGLSGGGTGGTVSLAIDFSEFSTVTPANGDLLATLDSDGSTEQNTSVAALATLFAGTGLTASSSVIGVDAAQTQITSIGTIGTGVWQGTVVASAYLDADTAHLSGSQTFTGTKTLNSFKGTGGATVTNILDEDAMGSDSATALATQQSIKAYVDASATDGSVTSLGTITQDTVTFTSANSTDPLINILNTTNDTSGARLRLTKDRGAAGTDGMEVGRIEFYGDDDAQTLTEFARIGGYVSDASNTAEGGKLILAVASHDGELNTGLLLEDGDAEDEIDVTIGQGTSSLTTVAGLLTVVGNLTVNGTTTTVNSTTTTVDDPIFTLGGDTAPESDDNKDRGIEFRYHDGSSARVGFFGWDDSATEFTGYTAATNSSEVFSGTRINANFAVGTFVSLDISTDVDVDGTLETDVLTIDGTAIVAQATASAVGGVELATAAEVITGTDTARVVTADTLSAKSVVATLAQSSLTDDNIVTVTHNLGTADVIVQLFDMSTEATVFADVYRTAADLSTASTSVISIDFGTAPANDIRCLITSLAGATASGTIAYT